MKAITLSFTILIFGFFYSVISIAQTGRDFWKQEVNYRISVSLDDVHHSLDGYAEIEYVNNSPDDIREIYFHLWPNAYSNDSSALAKQFLSINNLKFFNSKESERGYISKLQFKAGGKELEMIPDSIHIDICKIILTDPLKSGDRIIISTPFYVKIPSAKFSRLGHIGESYFITQWYPKPAVYDRFGWHPMPYLDQGEFYSEFGSFDVSITMPKNYVVGASGDLQTESEIEFMNKKAAAAEKLNEFPNDHSFPASDPEMKTIVFKQVNVHDFAWFADKRYHVMKSEADLPHSKKKVTTWTLFTNHKPELWKEAIAYVNNAVYYYSLWNGDYPYKNCTAVDGTVAAGGGMEYPCITIINTPASAFELEDVIVHEVGHNWFYGILGTNERDHAWMDEGINSFYELRYIETRIAEGKLQNLKDEYGLDQFGKIIFSENFGFRDSWLLQYLLTARTHNDQPVDTHSEEFTELNYGFSVYVKAALIFYHLKNYLGDSLFDSCMKAYFETWKFNHPYPDDLRKIFESRTGKNLSWFFDDLLKTNKKLDYAVTGIRRSETEPGKNNFIVSIKNKGGVKAPFSISGINKNGNIQSTRWIEGFAESAEINFNCTGCHSLLIDADKNFPEINRRNNDIRTYGVFRKWQLPGLLFIGRPEPSDRPQIFFLPALGWNNYNKMMAGVVLYNKFIPHKNLEYSFIPLYAPRTKNFAGTGKISYTIYPERAFFHHMDISAGVQHFAFNYQKVYASDQDAVFWYFTSVPLELKFQLRKSEPRSVIQRYVKLRSINTWQDQSVYDGFDVRKKNIFITYQQAIYHYENTRSFDPYRINFTIENGKKYGKAMLEANYRFSYNSIRRGVNIRFFAGAFLYHNTNDPVYNFHLSSSPGYRDYLYDHIFAGRNEADGILSQQMMANGGGFKILSAIGSSDRWIGALNFSADLWRKLPLAFYFDIGTYHAAWEKNAELQKLAFDGGLKILLIRNVAEIYLPLFKSSDISNSLDANDVKYKSQIRFLFDLNLLNPFLIRDRVLKDY